MGKLIVVENDRVEGTDVHNVKGQATNPPPPPATVPYKGVGRFDYAGKMTADLNDFVRAGGKPVAVTSSLSSLNPGQDVPPDGGHSGPAGSNFQPSSPVPIPLSLRIDDKIGVGKPSAAAGSRLVKVEGAAVLLDGDPIDTCDASSTPRNSTVTAGNQDFVSCSE